MKSSIRNALLFVLTACAGGVVNATTLSFNYSGVDFFGMGNSVGSGRLNFADGLMSVRLGDLTGFSFSQTTTVPIGTSTFSYALSDLLTFSMTLTGASPATLSLTTNAINGSNPTFVPEFFVVSHLGPGGAKTGNSSGPPLQVGQVSFTPEPASLVLLPLGLAGVGLLRRVWRKMT